MKIFIFIRTIFHLKDTELSYLFVIYVYRESVFIPYFNLNVNKITYIHYHVFKDIYMRMW